MAVYGEARLGEVWLGKARHGQYLHVVIVVLSWLGMGLMGGRSLTGFESRSPTQDKACQSKAMLVMARRCWARQGHFGAVGIVGFDSRALARRGSVWLGRARHGTARLGTGFTVGALPVVVWRAKAWRNRARDLPGGWSPTRVRFPGARAGLVVVGHGTVRFGSAWRGKAGGITGADGQCRGSILGRPLGPWCGVSAARHGRALAWQGRGSFGRMVTTEVRFLGAHARGTARRVDAWHGDARCGEARPNKARASPERMVTSRVRFLAVRRTVARLG